MQEIVLIIGYNASGKTTHVKEFVDKGYSRVNRDLIGGSLNDLIPHINKEISKGSNIVLDNTYPSIESRKPVIDLAKSKNIPIRCIWLTTSFEDSQLNACLRMVEKHKKLIMPNEFASIKDPNTFPPVALFSYKKSFEEPTIREGFSNVEKRNFKRVWAESYVNKALFLDYDGTLRTSSGKEMWPEKPEDIQIMKGRKEVLKRYVDDGYRLIGVSNQSAIAKGLDEKIVIECFKRTNELLGFDIEFMYCPHKIPPVTCYCRKPHPGMGAYFIQKYNLNPNNCIMVGDQTTDETFAKRCGFKYEDQASFFG